MRSERRRQRSECRRYPWKWRDPGGYGDAPYYEVGAIVQDKPEASGCPCEKLDPPPVDLGDCCLAIPVRVIEEVGERDRESRLSACLRAPAVESERPVRRGDVRGSQGGSEKHARRHVVPPELHRRSKRHCRNSGRSEICRGGEPVRARPDYGDLDVGCWVTGQGSRDARAAGRSRVIARFASAATRARIGPGSSHAKWGWTTVRLGIATRTADTGRPRRSSHHTRRTSASSQR